MNPEIEHYPHDDLCPCCGQVCPDVMAIPPRLPASLYESLTTPCLVYSLRRCKPVRVTRWHHAKVAVPDDPAAQVALCREYERSHINRIARITQGGVFVDLNY